MSFPQVPVSQCSWADLLGSLVCLHYGHHFFFLALQLAKMYQWMPTLVHIDQALDLWPLGWSVFISFSPDSLQARELSKSQDMWQPLSFFQILWAQNLMWSPPFYHWLWHHRIYTTTLPLKLGNCLLFRSLQEFSYWFWSCYLVTIQSVMWRPHPPNPVLCAFSYTAGCNFACGICKYLFQACPQLSILSLCQTLFYSINLIFSSLWLCGCARYAQFFCSSKK